MIPPDAKPHKEVEHKWLLSEVPEPPWNYKVVRIEQIYNPYNSEGAERVRMINDGGKKTFYHCIKTPSGHGANLEDEREVSEELYWGKVQKYELAGANRVVKDRMIFEYGDHILN